MERSQTPVPPRAEESDPALPLAGRTAALLFLGALLALGYLVLRDFIVPLVWAGILTYVSWPLYRWLHHPVGLRTNLSALLMTLLIAILIVLPLLFGGALLADEFADAYQNVREWLGSGSPQLPEALLHIPWLGERLQELLERVVAEPEVIRSWLAEDAGQWLQRVREILGAIGRNAFKLGIALLALFFFLRDGERLVAQMRSVLQRWLGRGAQEYWRSMADTTRGVVFG
ncbi:MAG: AI-2E family transporter, partial [Pseudomonadota bacterium]|nr:AI-2E family transporter [Pseudomonadota bacterium]